MRLTFWKARKGYEDALAPLLAEGAARLGDEVIIRPLEEYREPEGDGGIICGVVKRDVLWDHQDARLPLLYLDKGFYRDRRMFRGQSLPAWWRLCWQAVHPTAYLMAISRPPDRWNMLRQPLADRAPPGDHIVILGSSQKFHETMRLPHPTDWARTVLAGIRQKTDMRVIYRPKPSWADATAVDGADFEHGGKIGVERTLANAACSVTFGSIACVDSIVAGVPCIVLGNAVAKSVCGHNIHSVVDPFWPARAQREQWAANLAYCHFTPAELEGGQAWSILKGQLPHAI